MKKNTSQNGLKNRFQHKGLLYFLSVIYDREQTELRKNASFLISRFWINFTIIIWNSLSGRFPIDFKTKAVKRDKEGHYIMIKGSIQEEDI